MGCEAFDEADKKDIEECGNPEGHIVDDIEHEEPLVSNVPEKRPAVQL